MERIKTEPFPGDAPANRAVAAVGTRISALADLTKRIANGSYRDEKARLAAIGQARDLLGIIQSRARSGGVVDHEMETFMAAACRRAGVTLYPIPTVGPAPHDPIVSRLREGAQVFEHQLSELGRRRERAKRQLAALDAQIAAAGQQLADVNRQIAFREETSK